MADAIESIPIPDTPPAEAKATQGAMSGIAAIKKACTNRGLDSKYAQCAILGMHAIKDRPVVENGQIVIRPIMYLALSYDHRLVDGREAVQFLVTIKECLESPAHLLLNI